MHTCFKLDKPKIKISSLPWTSILKHVQLYTLADGVKKTLRYPGVGMLLLQQLLPPLLLLLQQQQQQQWKLAMVRNIEHSASGRLITGHHPVVVVISCNISICAPVSRMRTISHLTADATVTTVTSSRHLRTAHAMSLAGINNQ